MDGKKTRKPSKALIRTLADNLREFRARKGLSQENLAGLCGLHRTYVGAVERGERNATLSTLESFACALGITVPQLLTKGGMSHEKDNP